MEIIKVKKNHQQQSDKQLDWFLEYITLQI